MAADLRLSNAAANAALDALAALYNNGYLRIYDGTIPTNADTALGSQVLLAELRWNATAFGASVAGVATANAITADASADATGTATWFRALKSDGITVIADDTIGTSGEGINLNTTSIVTGGNVSVTSYTLTLPKT